MKIILSSTIHRAEGDGTGCRNKNVGGIVEGGIPSTAIQITAHGGSVGCPEESIHIAHFHGP